MRNIFSEDAAIYKVYRRMIATISIRYRQFGCRDATADARGPRSRGFFFRRMLQILWRCLITRRPQDMLDPCPRPIRYDIWIIEAATAADPSVKQVDIALDRHQKLDDIDASPRRRRERC